VSESAASTARERWIYTGLAALLALLWLATLSDRPLFNPDEGRYAEIPREMLSGGDWVIPHLNGLAYIEKPPLQYWATALSYSLFGVTQFSARLYTALSALGTIALVGGLAARLWGASVAWRTAAILPGMLIFLVLGQLLTLDMSLTFFMTGSLVAFVMAQHAARPLGWMLLAWAAAALGVLTKGLVAAGIPAAVLILYSLWTRDVAPWRRLYLRLGVPLLLAITVPWHWIAAGRLHDFLQFFFVREHFARYFTPVSHREESWWFFGAVFLAGSAPWTVSAIRVMCGGWRRPPRAHEGIRGLNPGNGAGFETVRFLWIWVIFIGVFFSLSDSKLMPYLLPAMPALALLIGALPSATLKRDLRLTAILTILAGVIFGLASLHWAQVLAGSSRIEYFLPLAHPLGRMALLLAISGAFVMIRCAREVTRAAVFLGVSWCLTWLLLVRAAATVAPVYSGASLAAGLPLAERAAPFYSVGVYDQSLVFYLRRSVTLVAYRGELDYGLTQTPGAEISDLNKFIPLWSSQPHAFAVMENDMFNDLKSRGVPMHLLAHNADRVVVARP
jgi:4-amino-4-deoxy-L-arabinose transferase-like glycosyltransferase